MSTGRTDPGQGAARYGTARWNALGSYAALVVADADRLAAARAGCERLLAEVDLAASRFRPDSDLSRVNRAAGRWVPVSAVFVQALGVAVEAAADTDGLLDPTLGRQLAALGYDRDIDDLRRATATGRMLDSALTPQLTPELTPGLVHDDPARIGAPARCSAWREIEIDPQGAVRIPADVALDLGATGKAFAADLIAARVPARSGTDLVISLGGDVAVGSRPGAPVDGHPWRVSVAELPQDTDRPDNEIVQITEGGMATSSVLARRWWNNGEVHHLLDPRTGRPVEAVFRTVTACGRTCVAANAVSTASIVRGAAAVNWLEQRDVAARLVTADGSVLRVAGWPDPTEPTVPQQVRVGEG